MQELGSEEGGKVAQNVAAGVVGLFIWPVLFANWPSGSGRQSFNDAANKLYQV